MVKKMGWFLKLLLPRWVRGITLAPFGIYVTDLDNHAVIAHEMIHWRQQLEMMIIFFYLWYLIEWTVKLFKYGSQAYVNISFEKAAYLGDSEPYSWRKYL